MHGSVNLVQQILWVGIGHPYSPRLDGMVIARCQLIAPDPHKTNSRTSFTLCACRVTPVRLGTALRISPQIGSPLSQKPLEGERLL